MGEAELTWRATRVRGRAGRLQHRRWRLGMAKAVDGRSEGGGAEPANTGAAEAEVGACK